MVLGSGNEDKYSKDNSPRPEECIYNLLPQPDVAIKKSPRYKSVHNDKVKEFYKKIKSPHRTMGYYKTPLNAPKEFLRKHSKEPVLAEKKPFKYPDEDKKKPPVPKHNEQPILPAHERKNFIEKNINKVVNDPAAKPLAKSVDTKNGDWIVLEHSGLVPKYLNKQEFGKVPKYIVGYKKDMEYAKNAYNEFVQDQYEKDAPHRLTDAEKDEILDGLKQNWKEVHHEYQGLSLITDTMRKKTRKERLEDELKRLEKDMKLIERHRDIYVLKE